MAQASNHKRYVRRLKRELSQSRRLIDMLIQQRNEARIVASALEEELRKYDPDPFSEGEDTTPIVPSEDKAKEDSLKITMLPDEPETGAEVG